MAIRHGLNILCTFFPLGCYLKLLILIFIENGSKGKLVLMQFSQFWWFILNQTNNDNNEQMSIVLVTSVLVALILNLGSQQKKAFKTLMVMFMFESPSMEQVRKFTFRVSQTWIPLFTCSLLAV